METIAVSRGRIAIKESWLVEHRDYHGYMTLEDAKVLLAELTNAVNGEIAAQSIGTK